MLSSLNFSKKFIVRVDMITCQLYHQINKLLGSFVINMVVV